MKNKRAIMILLLLIALILAAVFLPLEDIIRAVVGWAEQHPGPAVFAVGGLLVVTILLILPVSPVIMLAGFLFGLWQGLLVVWLAGMIASTLTFLIGRTAARPWVERRIGTSSTFIAIDRAIARKGFLIVFLTRLVMVIPYTALNYSLGLTRVSTSNYLLGTNLGMIPPFFLVVYLGTTVSNIAAIFSGDVGLEGRELLVGAAGLACVVLIVAIIIRSSLKVLKEELETVAAEQSSEA